MNCKQVRRIEGVSGPQLTRPLYNWSCRIVDCILVVVDWLTDWLNGWLAGWLADLNWWGNNQPKKTGAPTRGQLVVVTAWLIMVKARVSFLSRSVCRSCHSCNWVCLGYCSIWSLVVGWWARHAQWAHRRPIVASNGNALIFVALVIGLVAGRLVTSSTTVHNVTRKPKREHLILGSGFY